MKTNIINTQPPSGFKDLLPKEKIFKQWCVDIISSVFSKYGYDPIETPSLERIEVCEGKSGEELNKLMFKIAQRGEKSLEEPDLGLRYDFTVPLARFFAEYKDKLPKIFKRQQIGPCWRAERAGKGRFKEFYQADIDTIGSKSLLVEVDTILALAEALNKIGLDNLVVRINSRQLLQVAMDLCQIAPEQQRDCLIALDKFYKIGKEGVLQELIDRGIDKQTGENILDILSDKTLLQNKIRSDVLGAKSLQDIEQVVDLVNNNSKYIVAEFAPFIIRGQDYYSGIIFEIYSGDISGAMAGGGRFDNLIGIFSNNNVPACGGSIGLERVLSVLEELGKNNINNSRPKILVSVWDSSMISDALDIATKLRDQNIQTDLFMGEDKIGEQLKYAVDSGCKYCIIYGPDEKNKKEVVIKNLETKEQQNIPLEQLTNFNI